MATVTRKLGANRGATRLWLEGAVLTNAGFPHGARWSVEVMHNSGLRITLDRDGARKIAGTIERPIIDINTNKLLDVVGDPGEFVEIINAAPGLLYVRKVAA